MTDKVFRWRTCIALRVLTLVLCCAPGSHAALDSQEWPAGSALGFVVGTWTGSSKCVGDRPACRDETVVYRIVPVDTHPGQVRLFGDKILNGKRIPMGVLIFDVDEQSRMLRNEFKAPNAHGVWSFTVVAPDSMTGTLLILPDKSIARDVKVHRVSERDVPEAPPESEYEE